MSIFEIFDFNTHFDILVGYNKVTPETSLTGTASRSNPLSVKTQLNRSKSLFKNQFMAPVSKEFHNVVKSAKSVSSTSTKLGLLKKVLSNDVLIKSKIIPSVQPNISKKYFYKDLSSKANTILEQCKINLLNISVMEAERSLSENNNSLKLQRDKVPEQNKESVLNLVKETQSKFEHAAHKKHDKKVNFFQNKEPTEKFPVRNPQKLESRKKYRLRSVQRKTHMRKNWQRNRSTSNKEAIEKTAVSIKASNIVANLSHEEIPDMAYIYLTKGLKSTRKIYILT